MKKIMLTAALIGLTACGGGASTNNVVAPSPTPAPTPAAPAPTPTPAPSPTPSPSPAPSPSGPTTAAEGVIRVNQLGFEPQSAKVAVIANINSDSTGFELINATTGAVVMSADLSAEQTWALSGERVKTADFSSYTVPGEYRVRVNNIGSDSATFSIGNGVFADAHRSVIKAYYFNRASLALDAQYAGEWARAAGHPDTNVSVAENAASAGRPAGTVISAPKGWYDAGDFNKYVVNSGISTYTLLAAFEHFSSLYTALELNIPESNNTVPDILDEIKWNLDWLQAMQDTDGGVYHKLTHEGFSGRVMPSDATAPRYVVQKSTAAALNFAAVLATASRVFTDFNSEFPDLSAHYRAAAISAYQWAKANPNIAYRQTFSSTGEYGDSQFADEFAWAAAELFILTGESNYWADFVGQNQNVSLPTWNSVAALAFISLSYHADSALSAEQKNMVDSELVSFAETLVQRVDESAYGVPMFSENFNWGSNSNAANHGMLALQAYRLSDDARFKYVAIAAVDYLFGRNAVGYSFVTGFGTVSPQDPHHRQSSADSVAAPVPGFLVGGPNPGQQDNCPNYIGSQPALSYVDDWCSYASNEVTINWNAPLVYLLGGILAD